MQGLTANPNNSNNTNSNNSNPQNTSNNPQANRQSTIDVPVRILVPSESVGAIIGKGGQTIRQLTQQTRAKVDVYRGDPMAPTTALQEKVITIRGQPENCINACREIMKVMKEDAESKGKPSDMPLKVLAHNDYIGRIIGKQGNIINTIKTDTETTVTVSSISDMSMNVERVITVKGDLENMIRALEIIHSKVKSAFENDTKTYGSQVIMMGAIPPMPLTPASFAQSNSYQADNRQAHRQSYTGQSAQSQQQSGPMDQKHKFDSGSSATTNGVSGIPTSSSNSGLPPYGANYYTPSPYAQQPHHLNNMFPMQHTASMNGFPQQMPQQEAELIETVYLYIPNVAVGAIIGTKGSFIKNIIKLSGASVKITPLSPEDSKIVQERQVCIIGTPEAQWKAQYYIYEKIRQERFASDENVKLRAELEVPAHIVGRIIGKSGKNVRELQRTTGATIKLPEDAAMQLAADATAEDTTEAAKEASVVSAADNSSLETSKVNDEAAKLVVAKNETVEQTEEVKKSDQASESNEAKEALKADLTPKDACGLVANPNFVVVRIFGTFSSSQCAQRRIQSLVAQSSRGGALTLSASMGMPLSSMDGMQAHLANAQVVQHNRHGAPLLLASGYAHNSYAMPQHLQQGGYPMAHQYQQHPRQYPHQNGGPNMFQKRNYRHHAAKNDSAAPSAKDATKDTAVSTKNEVVKAEVNAVNPDVKSQATVDAAISDAVIDSKATISQVTNDMSDMAINATKTAVPA